MTVGAGSAFKADLSWDRFEPLPRSVSLVEVNSARGVVKRLVTVSAPTSGSSSEATFSLDTSVPREVSIAPEVTFNDGTVELGTARHLRVATAEQLQREHTEMDDDFEKINAVEKRWKAVYPEACKDGEAAAAWLRQQPEVSSASYSSEHKTMSFTVGQTPLIVQCRQ